MRAQPFWGELVERTARLAGVLDAFAADCGPVLERVGNLSEEISPQIRYLATELGALSNRLRAVAETLVAFVEDDAAHCAWIERRTRTGGGAVLSLHRAPVAVATQLAAALFDPFSTTLLTSATLTVDGRFDFLHQRIGVERVAVCQSASKIDPQSASNFDPPWAGRVFLVWVAPSEPA